MHLKIGIIVACAVISLSCNAAKDWDQFKKEMEDKAGLPEKKKCKPIHEASKKGDVVIVRTLLANGANPNQIGCFWEMTPIQTALFEWSFAGSTEGLAFGVLDLIFFKKSYYFERAVRAQFLGNKDNAYLVTEILLEYGGRTSLENKDDGFSRTALHIAAMYGHARAIPLLCNNGAYKEAIDDDGSTPLHLAAIQGHTDVVKALITCGANVLAPQRSITIKLENDPQSLPIHLAALSGIPATVDAFVAAGMNINQKDIFGSTPLHYAAQALDKPMIEYLLAKGALKDSKNKFEKSPVGTAVAALRAKNKDITNAELLVHPIVMLLTYTK